MKFKPFLTENGSVGYKFSNGTIIQGEELLKEVKMFYEELVSLLMENDNIGIHKHFIKNKNNPGMYIAMSIWLGDSITLSRQPDVQGTVLRTMMGDDEDFILDEIPKSIH